MNRSRNPLNLLGKHGAGRAWFLLLAALTGLLLVWSLAIRLPQIAEIRSRTQAVVALENETQHLRMQTRQSALAVQARVRTIQNRLFADGPTLKASIENTLSSCSDPAAWELTWESPEPASSPFAEGALKVLARLTLKPSGHGEAQSNSRFSEILNLLQRFVQDDRFCEITGIRLASNGNGIQSSTLTLAFWVQSPGLEAAGPHPVALHGASPAPQAQRKSEVPVGDFLRGRSQDDRKSLR